MFHRSQTYYLWTITDLNVIYSQVVVFFCFFVCVCVLFVSTVQVIAMQSQRLVSKMVCYVSSGI